MTDIEAARERVATWVKGMQDATVQKRTRDEEADRQSLDRAADLEAIYQAMDWVGTVPQPKLRLGRRVNPKSREQFAKWVKQTYEWGTKQRLSQLAIALELLPILSTTVDRIQPTGERPLRPFTKLRDQGYGDHQAEVWAEAVHLAGGLPPTEAQVRKAVTAFLDRHKPPIKNTAADPQAKDERRIARRARLIAQFDELLNEENRTARDVLNEMTRHYNEHQAVLREERAS